MIGLWFLGAIALLFALIAFFAHLLGFLHALANRLGLPRAIAVDIVVMALGCIAAWKWAQWRFAVPEIADATTRSLSEGFAGVFGWGWVLAGTLIQWRSLNFWRKKLG